MIKAIWIYVVCSAFAPCVSAYELLTHGRMTFEAIKNSVLIRDPSLGSDLGLPLNDAVALSNQYFDVSGYSAAVRKPSDFEARYAPIDKSPLSVAAWIMRGAVREDDLSALGCAGNALFAVVPHGRSAPECNPQDDPYENFIRVRNHFFDPYLSKAFSESDPSARDWALGVTGSPGPDQPNPARKNHFSLIDARNAMYYALAGKDRAGTVLLEDGRNAYWATVFRSLGDAVHLLQDMAQPQHTRGEAHPGSPFEYYIEQRARGGYRYEFKKTPIVVPELSYAGYPVTAFPSYSQFWTSGISTAFATRTGLADYSNRGFFTEGKNFGSYAASTYPSPSLVRSDYSEELISLPEFQAPGTTLVFKFLKGSVKDALSGASDTIRMTTESAFTSFGRSFRYYGLNRYNFDDQAALLVPRAVGYSAGLIDYFFRARIDCLPSVSLPTGCRFVNLSSETMANGSLELYYDAVNDTRQLVARWSVENLPPSNPSNPQDGMLITFQPPITPAPKAPGQYILVYRGDLGAEKAFGGEAVGAVAAKIIGTPNSKLYVLAVQDGHLTTFVTDNAATRPIASDAFNPMKDWLGYQLSYYGTYRRWNTITKAYVSRQAAFGPGPFTNQYQVKSLRMSVGGSLPFTYVRTDAAGALSYKTYGGWRWLASSSDPAIGSFVFQSPQRGQLAFERTYDAAGTKVTVNGSLSYTPVPSSTDLDLAGGSISGDGSRLGEVSASSLTVSTSPGCTRVQTIVTTKTYYDMLIALSANPAVSFEPLDTTTSTSTSTQVFREYPNGLCGETIDKSASFSTSSRALIGYIRGAKELYRTTASGTSTGLAYGDCTYNSSTTSTTWTLSGGSGAVSASSSCVDGKIVNSGGGSAPSWMLDGEPRNAIWSDTRTSRSEFRGIQAVSGQYVHDVSPIGEVFFATADGATIVHEPAGGRPRFIKPAGVTQVLAAFYM